MGEWTYKDGWYRQYDLEKKRWVSNCARWTAEQARNHNSDRKRNGISVRWVWSKKKNKV